MLLSAPAGGIGGTTGVPLGICAAMLARGEVASAGVHSPEAGLDARAFLDRLARRCDPPRASVDELLLVSRSWEPGDLLERLTARMP